MLTKLIANQQQKPSIKGFAPENISFLILVFRPIATIAIIIKNLLKYLKKEKILFIIVEIFSTISPVPIK